MTNRFLTLIALLAGLSLALPAMAQQPQSPAGDQVAQLAEALDLSEQQQTDIRAVIDEYGPQIESLQERAQRAQMELSDKVGHDYDEAAIRAGATRLGELTGEMTALSLLLQSKVQALFTPEQRQQLEMQAQRQRQMQEQMMRQQYQQQGQPGAGQTGPGQPQQDW